jgi:hypothetical protein
MTNSNTFWVDLGRVMRQQGHSLQVTVDSGMTNNVRVQLKRGWEEADSKPPPKKDPPPAS